ncbi:uncharacterized protein EV422DRAFT_494143 [Fimicolochytrium jonesii]|uniref:uncharacterized protein n=1 Tax=Fimicolochytrium jonesii TaxID=1396493 RepID=UPI0022FEB332|nr:uncharacterized protein EV422DRAFT_494143 [Fimicolochytrium jonesii]KAI8822916.1 hypothetical protein EV422DRAFT_494143 [Fimicolochytrium jonesii]
MVEIGTAFESDTIASLRSFHMDLRRVGGANDKGVDLRGKWVLSGSAGSSAPHTVPIIVQCKASRTPLGPKYLRELEGTLARESAGTIAVMACYEGYTRAAVEVCLGSVRPMILAVVERVGRRCVGFTMNRATQYLLPGVRMVRGEAGVRVWYGGRCLGEGVGGGG